MLSTRSVRQERRPRTPVLDVDAADDDNEPGMPEESVIEASASADPSTAAPESGAVGDAPTEPEPSDAEQAALETVLESLVTAQDAWGFVNMIDERKIPQAHRQQHYQHFIGMVATRSLSEQDALINRGVQVFKFRSETARRDVAALREDAATATQISATVICDDFIADIVYVPNTIPAIQYAVYRPDGSVTFEQQVQVGGIIHMPPLLHRLVEMRALSLPTGVADEHVSTLAIVEAIDRFVDKYTVLAADDRRLSAIYVLDTWIADALPLSVYLRFLGDFGTGKTRAVETLASISRLGILSTASVTPPVIYRLLTLCPGTLALDEADLEPESQDYGEILRILRSGTQRRGVVLRNEKGPNDTFSMNAFQTFGPKIFGARKPFKDRALESRCVTITMKSTALPVDLPLVLDAEFEEDARALRNRLLRWRFDRRRGVQINSRLRLPRVGPRATQIAIALLPVAEDAATRLLIEQQVRRLSEETDELRRDSLEGRVAEAVVARWRRNQRPQARTSILLLDDITAAIRREDEHITSALVKGAIHALGFRTLRRGGYAHIMAPNTDTPPTNAQIQDLAARYGIAWRTAVVED
jgi:hypothetical protein